MVRYLIATETRVLPSINSTSPGCSVRRSAATLAWVNGRKPGAGSSSLRAR